MSLIFDIKRYSIHDGPGIRITIFFKGCPLSCVWCHNPEGISAAKQKMYTRKRCIGCHACTANCRAGALSADSGGIVTDNALCTLCGTCTEVCPSKAMEISGADYSADYLMDEIEKETVFMDQSDGGVTFCGGEPLMHPALLLELLKRCGKLGIHRAVDTTLYARPRIVQEVMKETDLFLVDLKLMDSSKHLYYCGAPNERILSNLQMVAEGEKEIIVRIPLIKGINADAENIKASAEFLASLPPDNRRITVHLLPYHDIAGGKHEKSGTVYNPEQLLMSTPTEAEQQQCVAIFENYGIKAIPGG